jgi:hypothetical protein
MTAPPTNVRYWGQTGPIVRIAEMARMTQRGQVATENQCPPIAQSNH